MATPNETQATTFRAARKNLPDLLRARAQYNARKFGMGQRERDEIARDSIEWEAADGIERLRKRVDDLVVRANALNIENTQLRYNIEDFLNGHPGCDGNCRSALFNGVEHGE